MTKRNVAHKEDLAYDLQERLKKKGTNVTIKEAMNLITDVLGVMQDTLESGKSITFRNFGSFRVQERKARHARDMRTNELMDIPAKKLVRFKQSKHLKIK